jgi:hypothetical protein
VTGPTRPQGFPRNQLRILQRQAQPGTSLVTDTRAIVPTATRMGCSFEQARDYALETVRQLNHGMFVNSVEQRGSWFDVYGCYRDGLGWFVKVGSNDDGLLVLSHHEPEFGSLLCADGTVVHPMQPGAPAQPEDEAPEGEHE